jgi:hypothetical protein
VAAVLAWVPLSSGPLPGRRLLYKAPFPPGPVYSEYMPLVRLGSRWSPASVDLVGSMPPLIKRRLGVFVIFAGSGIQW